MHVAVDVINFFGGNLEFLDFPKSKAGRVGYFNRNKQLLSSMVLVKNGVHYFNISVQVKTS